MAESQPEATARKRGRFQFSLSSLMLLVLFVSLGMSWLAVRIERARKQEEAVEKIRKLGAGVTYDYEESKPFGAAPPGPAWLRALLGEHFFATVDRVSFIYSADDADLEYLEELTQLEWLELSNAKVTDAGLKHLKGLTRLRRLDLDNTRVTGSGLEDLKGLTQLVSLGLGKTPVTDAGLEHVKGFSQLEYLSLCDTNTTGSGLERLKSLRHLRWLNVGGDKVTDATLEHLKDVTQLRELALGGRNITDAGLEHLKALTQLRQLRLYGTRVTDASLEHLKGLSQLESLYLDHTQVTNEGVKRLQQSLPYCTSLRTPSGLRGAYNGQPVLVGLAPLDPPYVLSPAVVPPIAREPARSVRASGQCRHCNRGDISSQSNSNGPGISPWGGRMNVSSVIEANVASKYRGGQPSCSGVTAGSACFGCTTSTTSKSASGVPSGMRTCSTPSFPVRSVTRKARTTGSP
jgi:hypothetical protein